MLRRALAVAVTVAACAVLAASAPASLVGGPEPLWFGPSWMPAGFVELGRQYGRQYDENYDVWKRGAKVREWAPAGTHLLAGSGASVELRPESHCTDRRDPVDVGGRPAWYFDRTVDVPLERGVCWEPAGSGSLKLETRLTSVSRDDLLRIARSVRPALGSTAPRCAPASTWLSWSTRPGATGRRRGLTADRRLGPGLCGQVDGERHHAVTGRSG
jgi:hypothetical protein